MGRTAEFDRAEVVGRALEVFRRKGYKATSIPDLEQATGLLRGSLYAAFGDKRGLFREALQQYEAAMLKLADYFQTEESPLEAVKNSLRQLLAASRAEGVECSCLAAHTILESAAGDRELVDQAFATFVKIEKLYAEQLARARAAGELSDDKDPVKIARFLTCFWNGLRVSAQADPGPGYLEDALETAFAIFD